MRQLTTITILTLALLATSTPAFAGSDSGAAKQGVLWRTVLSLGGGFGGALLSFGLMDDDRYSANQVVTTMALVGVGGAVGGFFLGRHLDKQSSQRSQDELSHALLRHHWRQGRVEGITPIRFSTAELIAASR